MTRPLRVHDPDLFYHVLSRGNERRPIFRDEQDCERFLELLGELRERFKTGIWSYVLMRNHYHLILRPGETPLSRPMQWLGVAYSTWHNHRHRRSGHLFQGRFKAIAVLEEQYLERLICYVHRNPLRAKVVERLADYRWSSYVPLAYGRGCPEWLDRAGVLNLYGDAKTFRQVVQRYSEKEDRLFENLRNGWFLGSRETLSHLWNRLAPKPRKEIPASRKLRGDIEDELKEYCAALNVSPEELALLSKPVRGHERWERDMLMHMLWRSGEYRLSEIGQRFGVGYTSVVNARKRAEDFLQHHPRTARRINKAFSK